MLAELAKSILVRSDVEKLGVNLSADFVYGPTFLLYFGVNVIFCRNCLGCLDIGVFSPYNLSSGLLFFWRGQFPGAETFCSISYFF